MSRFDRHFRMNEADAIAYIREKTDFFAPDAALECAEIGDGNMNYVFRVHNAASGKSLILKHADVEVRIKSTRFSTQRSRIEAEALKLHGRLAPGLVPSLYLYDAVMCCLVMEDLRDYQSLRGALAKRRVFPRLAGDITDFMAAVLVRTTDVVLAPPEKKALAAQFANPELCEVSERLVYTNPYTNHDGCNLLHPPNKAFFERELYNDAALRLEAAKLKEQFKTKAQALIHGDLHTGSIFVREAAAGSATMVLDPEFAFYGPIGYDVGNVIANLIFAWANAVVTMPAAPEKDAFCGWLESTVCDVIDLFSQKALAILRDEATEVMAHTPGFAEWYLDDILTDTAGVTGLELNRRIVGKAKVSDIAGIADSGLRALAERICVRIAKNCIMQRAGGFKSGGDYLDAMKAAAVQEQAQKQEQKEQSR